MTYLCLNYNILTEVKMPDMYVLNVIEDIPRIIMVPFIFASFSFCFVLLFVCLFDFFFWGGTEKMSKTFVLTYIWS